MHDLEHQLNAIHKSRVGDNSELEKEIDRLRRELASTNKMLDESQEDVERMEYVCLNLITINIAIL